MIMKLYKRLKKKKWFWPIIGGIIIIGVFFGYTTLKAKPTDISYITTTPTRGMLSTIVSGSGQVSASNQINIKSNISGTILSLNASATKKVKSGDVLVQVDAQNAYRSVKDASDSLETSRLSLIKLKQPVDSLSLLQSESALKKAKDDLKKLKLNQKIDYEKMLSTKINATDAITKSYEDAFTKISDAFLDLPDMMTKLTNILYSYEISDSELTLTQNNTDSLIASFGSNDKNRDKIKIFINSAISDYESARTKYTINFTDYKQTSRYSSTSTITNLLTDTIDTVKLVSQALKSDINMLDSWVDLATQDYLTIYPQIKSYQSDLSTLLGKVNSHLSNLLSAQSSLQTSKNSLVDAENNIKKMLLNNPIDLEVATKNIKEKELSLANLKAGADALDIRSQEIMISQKLNTLYDAQQKLSDYTIKAPFDGTIATVDVKKGDLLSSSAQVATIISDKRLAVIAFNEVDVSKIKLKQKVILSMSAIENLSLTGEVVEIASLGAVTSGVVNYNVTIAFDTQDERVKPGMSVSADIITMSKNDVLMIPNSAIKGQGGNNYVEVKNGDNITQKIVTVGLSNDTMIEIVSGLSVDDNVITQTISGGASNTTQQPGFTRQSGGQFGGNSVNGFMRAVR